MESIRSTDNRNEEVIWIRKAKRSKTKRNEDGIGESIEEYSRVQPTEMRMG